MSMDMRALYYISMSAGKREDESERTYTEYVKANENCLNQNFKILTSRLAELEQRLTSLENTNN